VDIGTPLKANPQATELVKPTVRALDHPSEDAEAASVFRVTLCQNGLNAAPSQTLPMRFRIIRPVTLNAPGTPSTATFAANLRDRIDQGDQLRYVVGVRSRQLGRQRDAVGVAEHVMLRPEFAAIRGIRAGLRPPKTARTDVLSATARDQSSCFASSNFWRNTRWIFSHTPAACQSRNRRQHVMPDPHPISFGRNSHGIPVLRTNRMPVRTWRLPNGFRPGFRRCRFLGGGSSGSISFHNAPSRIGRAMAVPPCTARQYSQGGEVVGRPFC
jgi:hypothetical protein